MRANGTTRASLAVLIALSLALACIEARAADESSLVLKDGPDAPLTQTRCSVCHSLDYIQMNSPFLNASGWNAEVHKMISAMGAQIPEDEAARIAAYLTRYYGETELNTPHGVISPAP